MRAGALSGRRHAGGPAPGRSAGEVTSAAQRRTGSRAHDGRGAPLAGAPRPSAARAVCGSWSRPAVRDRFEDLDRGGATVRQVVSGGLADLLSRDSAAQRRAGRVHVDGRATFLAGGEQEGDLVLVAGEPDRHGHPGAHDALGPWRVAYLCVLEDVLDLPDPGFLLALFLLGGVIAAVLP